MKDGEEKVLMEEVVSLTPRGDEVTVRDIMGDEKIFPYSLDVISFISHNIYLQER